MEFSLILAPNNHWNSEKGTHRCILVLNFNAFSPTVLSLLPRCHALKWPDICREGLYSSSIYLPWGLMIEVKTQKKKKREQSTEGNVWVSSVIPEGLSRFTLCFCLDHKVYAWQDGWQNTKCRRLAGNDLSVPRPSFPGDGLSTGESGYCG